MREKVDPVNCESDRNLCTASCDTCDRKVGCKKAKGEGGSMRGEG